MMEYYDAIPKRITEALERYEHGGVLPGHFMQAVLSNNLFYAVSMADDRNYPILKQIVHYVYNEMPGNCWGSRDVVNTWVLAKQAEREAKEAAGLTN